MVSRFHSLHFHVSTGEEADNSLDCSKGGSEGGIRKVDLKSKQRDKTATEFGEALAVLLGRKADRRAMDYSTFRDCLTKMVA